MNIKASLLAVVLAALAGATDNQQVAREAYDDVATWLTYGQNYLGWRYSRLAEINAHTVSHLTPRWIHQTGISGANETTPLVFGGLMFITGPANNASALDLLTGKQIWHYQKPAPAGLELCCGQPNRGFAALGEKLFKADIEGTLVSLDARTGAVLWERKVADYRQGFTITGAPLVVKGKVLLGMAGAEFGTRGFIDAYDAASGERVWRFYTVPIEGEPGSESWHGESLQHGGGSTWITGTYDPELNTVYWGTGNPAPGLDGEGRSGDNLYTCSLVALDADTGKLRWYYQFTPHDTHDWDAIADPVLVDIAQNGRKVKALVQANRNGLFYVLDRTNGKLLRAAPYTEVNWLTGMDNGRPILAPAKEPTEQGTKVCPGMAGGHNWSATAYNPQTQLFYFSSADGCEIFYRHPQQFSEGQWYQASTNTTIPDQPHTGAVLAVDPASGNIRWRYQMLNPTPAGMLTTAGDLVFTGDSQGYFIALDAGTGEPLWHFQTGGSINAPPITYTLNGRQQIAIAAGASIITFALND